MTFYGMQALAPSAHGLMGRLVGEAANIRARLDHLTQQASSGMVAHEFSGLGTAARTILDLRPMLGAIQTWQGNIDVASGRMQVTQTAIERLTAIASDFYARVNTLNGLSTTNLEATAAAARDALREVTGLLNTKNGDIYVFSGRDTLNAAVPDGDKILSSGFYLQISTAVAGLSGAGATATVAATLAIASSNTPGSSPFSSYLSQPAVTLQSERPVVEIGEQRREAIGILASTNAVATSVGSTTTGSYMRDLMRALATIGSLTAPQISDPGFSGLVDDTRSSLRNTITAMATDAGILGDAQAQLAKRRTTMDHTSTAITGQIAAIADADMAAVLSHLSLTQTLLQSSYQMIGNFGQLSLAKYLA